MITETRLHHHLALDNSLVEGGGGGFSVRLATKPSGNVTVTISEEDDPGNKIEFKGGATETTLTFTRNANPDPMKRTIWHEPQTVSVWARQDDDTEGHNRYLSISPVGGGYHPGLTERLRVSVNDDDDDDGQNSPTDPGDQVPDTQVANVQASVIDAVSATVTWDAVEHATSYEVEWEGESADRQVYITGVVPDVTGTTTTIQHDAPEAMTLAIKVIPAYIDDNGDTRLLNDLAGTATLAVGPAGGGQDGAPASACVSDAQWGTVEGYYASNSGKAPNYGENWYRVLIAYAQERSDETLPAWSGATAKPSTSYTVAEAREGETVWSGWTPVREVLECVEAAHPPPPAPPRAAGPELSLTAGPDVDEGDGATFTVHADPAPQSDLTVRFTVAQSGDWLDAPGAGSRTLTLPAGAASADLTVATVDDATDEPDGSVSVTIDDGTDYTVAAGQASGTVAVADDDAAPVLPPPSPPACAPTLPADAVTVSEVTDWRDGHSGAAHALRWNRVLEALGEDTGSGATPLTAVESKENESRFMASRWDRVTRTLEAIEACADDDGDGSTTTTVVPPPPATPEISIASDGDITEGGNATFTLTANPAPTADLDVDVSVTQSGDYGVTAGSRTVTIGTGGSGALTVATSGDSADEPDGSVTATITDGAGYDVSATAGAATTAVADDDDAPVVPPPPPATPEISIAADGDITEGGNATFTLTASPAPGSALDVDVTVAQVGDYGVATGSRTVTIPAGGTGALTVATSGDSVDEADGSVTVTITDGTDYDVSATAYTATAAVNDDDIAAGLPILRVSDAVSSESCKSIHFRVSLNRPLADDERVSFAYDTLQSDPVSARPGFDYYPRRGWETIRAGKREAWFTIPLIADNDNDDGETIRFAIGELKGEKYKPTGATLGDSEGVGTIKDGAGPCGGITSTAPVSTGLPPAGLSGEVGNAAPETKPKAWDSENRGPGEFSAEPGMGACVSPRLFAEAAGYANETWRGPAHVEGWLRVLQTFSGTAGDAVVVTPAEARHYAAGGGANWLPVADALRCLESQALRNALSQ